MQPQLAVATTTCNYVVWCLCWVLFDNWPRHCPYLSPCGKTDGIGSQAVVAP